MVFSQETGSLYKGIKERIEKGSAFKVAGLFELSEAAGKSEVSDLLFRDPHIKVMGGQEEAVGKESKSTLDQLKEGLKNHHTATLTH
ncbi:MAG: hypothetical protein KC588_03415 [Nitrospira sp.]|nr:hypothetical protein [Nitrospira sp.]